MLFYEKVKILHELTSRRNVDAAYTFLKFLLRYFSFFYIKGYMYTLHRRIYRAYFKGSYKRSLILFWILSNEITT